MKRAISLLLCVAVSFAGTSLLFAQSQNSQGNDNSQGNEPVLIPGSSIENQDDIGKRAHTNHVILFRGQPKAVVPPGETPQSIRPVYNLPSTGGSGTIAIVDAYHYPSAYADLTYFSGSFSLPALNQCTILPDLSLSPPTGCFSRVYADSKGNVTSTPPATDCGWAQEAALDIEWAHAMAPNANIVLVEARSSSWSDLLAAVDLASQIVLKNGKGQVSMSWGGSEFRGENGAGYESHFLLTPGLIYFAASGDSGGKTIWPGVSPNVVSAGGTTINRKNGVFVSETGWSGSGGGTTQYYSRPLYQYGIGSIVGNQRGVPDFSFDADPQTGVSVYDTTVCQGMSGWMVFGGTSVSSPSLAGIVNLAGHFYSSRTTDELGTIYANMGVALDFRDIKSGKAGRYNATTGWDFVTGVGSNQGLLGK